MWKHYEPHVCDKSRRQKTVIDRFENAEEDIDRWCLVEPSMDDDSPPNVFMPAISYCPFCGAFLGETKEA
ncbi:hypothetical protein FACS18948_3200 [Clostridia bacterium]|nr:hypothetical protein FACS18948_3200 [Clostridia bacterium]